MSAWTRRRAVVAGVCAAALLVGGMATVLVVGVPERSEASSTAVAGARATVVRGDLVEEKTFSGVLGYGDPVPLRAGAGTGAGGGAGGAEGAGGALGTITWLPDFAETIGRDQELYRVDERPVRSMHGTVPVYRTLQRGVRGADVRQLTANLAALGYDVPQDDVFGARTATAVRAWQKDRGLPTSGVLGDRDIAFVPGDIRVAELVARVGAPADGTVLGYTSTARVVTATVSTTDAARFGNGSAVSIGFTGTSERLGGTVERVDARGDEGGDGGGGDAAGDVLVTVRIDGAVPGGVAESAGVDVVTTGASEEDVLSVPVNALLAGHADDRSRYVVETVSHSGTSKRVPVTIGFAAQGRVAISGRGIRAGLEVVVPS